MSTAGLDRVLVGSFSRRRLTEFRRLSHGRVPTSAHPVEVFACGEVAQVGDQAVQLLLLRAQPLDVSGTDPLIDTGELVGACRR